MDDAAEHPRVGHILARGWAGGAIGGAPIGWAVFGVLIGGGLTVSGLLVAALVGGFAGAVVGSLVGLFSGAVLAAREARPRTDLNQRLAAAATSATPFVLITAVLRPATTGGWLGGLAIAAVPAGAGAGLAPCVVHGWARGTCL